MQNNEHRASELLGAGKTAKRIQSLSMATASLLFCVRFSKVSSRTVGAKPSRLYSATYRTA